VKQVEEFKTLVRELHRAGIEVILDVVYNHTGEGSELGPAFSFKGIDNAVDTSLAAGEEFGDDGVEPLPDPADRYLVNPRTTVVLLGR